MAARELTQFVTFRTDLAPNRFVEGWQPVADGFLTRGLGTITLAMLTEDGRDGQDGGNGVRYVSRNTWPEPAYRRAFPSGLAPDGATPRVRVVQAGVFAVHPGGEEPVATARPDRDLSVALLPRAGASDADATIQALLGARPAEQSRQQVAYRGAHAAQLYDVMVTLHGPAGTGADNTAALRAAAASVAGAGHGLFLTGRELLSLTR